MATIYSLICFAGKNGKTPTMTIASPCVVTVTSHGLRAGTGVVFTTTGSLPTGVTSGTTYYANSTGANTFNLYDTAANAIAGGATGRVNTSGSQSGTHTIKSAYYVALSDKSRWTVSGTEYIFDSLSAWNTHRTTTVPTSLFTDEVCEIGMAWNEIGSGISISMRASSILVTTLVNGVRSDGFHDGIVGAGYILNGNNGGGNAISLSWFNLTIDGFTVRNGSGNTAVDIGVLASAHKIIVDQNGNHAFAFSGEQATAVACLAIGGTGDGFFVRQYTNAYIYSCIAAKQGTYGFTIASNPTYGFYYNNISIGNTTANWGTKPTALYSGSCNAGLLSDTVWNSTGGTAVTIATTDFTDYANNDFTAVTITSPQVDTGVTTPGGYAWDIADGVRPSYPGSAYNTAVTAGSFVAGLSYTIVTKGTTDFTACGATTNAVTFTDTGDTVGWTAHTLNNGDLIYFSVITTTTGISVDTLYYVVGKAANTFQVALTSGGSAIALTTNGTGTVVLPTFKATGVGTGTGTATLNAKYDIGAYEYDLGYGAWPNSVALAGSDIVSGTQISINKQSDGTEIYNGAPGTSYSGTYDTSSDVPVYIYARKGSAATYYQPVQLSGTIYASGGLVFSLSGLQSEDIAAATYDAQIDTDWGVNWSTGAITHDAGTTRYSVQGVYSMHQNESDASANMNNGPFMHGTTPTIFELINGGSITDGDLEDLYGGSIEFGDGTVWSNLYSAGSLAGSPDLYVVQNGSKVTSFWPAGHIDILVKTSNAGTLVDSGLLTAYARKYGYSYANYLVDCSGGGRNVAPLSTLADPTTTAISSATAATYSDITLTFSTTSHDLGEGGGSGSYRCVIDCAGRTLEQVYAYCQYITRDVSAATINSLSGWKYQKADASYTANAAAPFGGYAGRFWTVAQGVWIQNYAAADTYNFVLTDHAGTTHQLIAPTNQSVTISGATAGSRIQVYDTTSSTELYNGTPTFPYTWSDGSSAVADRAIRLRVSYVSGTSAKTFIEASIGTCGQTAETKDISYLVSQTNDTTYNGNAINGSTITGITFTDSGSNDRVDCNIAGGSVTYPSIYAAFVYWNFTATGIANDFTYVDAPDTANYLFSGMKIRNTSATDLMVTGGYGRDSTSGLSKDIVDTAGSTGNIFLAPDHVVAYQTTGTYAITGDISTVLTAVSNVPSATLAAAQTTPIHSDNRKVVGTALQGDGTEADKFRSVLVP